MPSASAAIDITGQQFGRLTAISMTRTQREYVQRGRSSSGPTTHFWSCKCTCGNVVEVRKGSLLKGHTRSCGCLYTDRRIDISGQQFGYLTAIKFTRRSENIKHRDYYWLCQCRCGKIVEACKADLVKGHKKSCGCLIRNQRIQFKALKELGIVDKRYDYIRNHHVIIALKELGLII